MFRFTLPRDIYCGHGAIDELSLLKGHKKAFICTGGHSMRAGGFLQKTEKVLKDAGLATYTLEGITPDPSIEEVQKGAKLMEEFQPDVIVAIGGGSPIDAAKAMWVFYEYPNLTFDEIKKPFFFAAASSEGDLRRYPIHIGDCDRSHGFLCHHRLLDRHQVSAR